MPVPGVLVPGVLVPGVVVLGARCRAPSGRRLVPAVPAPRYHQRQLSWNVQWAAVWRQCWGGHYGPCTILGQLDHHSTWTLGYSSDWQIPVTRLVTL